MCYTGSQKEDLDERNLYIGRKPYIEDGRLEDGDWKNRLLQKMDRERPRKDTTMKKKCT
jgi:hypothetical protein